MPAKLYIQIASCWPKLSSWIDGILLITTWSGPDYRDVIFAFTQIQSKSTSEKEKYGEKHSFSDGKRLLILFCWDVLLIFRHFGWQQKFCNFFYFLVIFCMPI
jgi:hypothetical protein